MSALAAVSKTRPAGAAQALADVSLRVERGEVCGVIGPSGAGKSTLIRLLNALEKPSVGRVSATASSPPRPFHASEAAKVTVSIQSLPTVDPPQRSCEEVIAP